MGNNFSTTTNNFQNSSNINVSQIPTVENVDNYNESKQTNRINSNTSMQTNLASNIDKNSKITGNIASSSLKNNSDIKIDNTNIGFLEWNDRHMYYNRFISRARYCHS